tara:strand:+ start:1968 stop:3614 length:1647 start_codon:yes stop_codon:yes gene_type:complete
MAKEDIINKDLVNELKDIQAENDQSHLEPVNVILGRFQPMTIGHLGMSKELEKINGLPSVYIYIRSKSGKNSKFTDKLTINYMEDVVKGQDLVKDAWAMSASFIPVIVMETQRRGYNPVLIGAGEDRVKTYTGMAKRMKNITTHPDFKVQELKGRLTSATEVRQAISDDDEKKFKKLTPKAVHPYYKQLKDELEKTSILAESLSVEDIVVKYDMDIDSMETILESYGENFFSDTLIIETILEHETLKDNNKKLTGKMNEARKPKLKFKKDYPTYNATYGGTLDAITNYVEDAGYKIDDQEFFAAFGDAFFKPKKGKTQSKTVDIQDKTGNPVGNLHVSIYNRGVDGNTYELTIYHDQIMRGLKESDTSILESYDVNSTDDVNELIKESFGEEGILVLEHILPIHNKAVVKSHTRIFERVLMFKRGELLLETLDSKEITFVPFLSKLSEDKLNQFKDSLNEMVNPDFKTKLDAAVLMTIKTNRPVVWEDFKSTMIRSDFFTKEFRPFLMMQGLSDFQIERYVDNLLRVKYQHYSNYYLGNPGLQYKIEK